MSPTQLQRRHLLLGWSLLLVSLLFGLLLEGLLAFRVPLYVDAAEEGRRLLLRLAHAHGALLGLLHLGTLVTLPALTPKAQRRASALLSAGSLLLPGGFLLGALDARSGEPGAGVLLCPLGALLLGLGALQVILGLTPRQDRPF